MFKEVPGVDALFTKTKEFHTQSETAKGVKRIVVHYFHFLLIKKKAIDFDAMPLRFAYWVDTSNMDSIFNEY